MSGWGLYWLSMAEKKTLVGWLEEVEWEGSVGRNLLNP